MDFSWTEAQNNLKATVIDFAQEALNEQLVERDHQSDFQRDKWRKCGECGIQGLFIPEAYGGQGKDILTTVFALEGPSRGFGMVPMSVPLPCCSLVLGVCL